MLVRGHAVRLHPLATLSAVSAALILAGLVCAFLAVPLTAIATQVSHHYLDRDREPTRIDAL